MGFVHASLEEYLASVHIHGWPMERILEFVRLNASNHRWRSVFGDLIARNTRRSEAEQIVRVISEPENDTVGALQRRLLLADVVFGGAEINRSTATKLAESSFEIIAGAGWINERTAHLTAALEGLYNPTLKDKTSENLNRWGIRSSEYLEDFYTTLSSWPRSEELLNILKHGIKDDNALNSRAAARSLAMIYKGDSNVEEWLISLLRGDTDLLLVGLTLEALVIGWPSNPILIELLNSASSSKDKALQLSVIWCKIHLGLHDDADLKTLINLLNWDYGLDYFHKGVAEQCLIQGWPNNSYVIRTCLNNLEGIIGSVDVIERDVAQKYLTTCDVYNSKICSWILSELELKHPFTMLFGNRWEWLLKFAGAHQDIREKLIFTVISNRMEYREHELRSIFTKLEDPIIKNYLIDKVRLSKGMSAFWCLAPLVEGWAARDPDVKDLIQEVLNWPDEQKQYVVNLLPKVLEREACIQELLRIAKSNFKIRFDLLISAFTQLDVSEDKEISNVLITKILSEPDSVYSGSKSLIALYPHEPKVKEYALRILEERNPPLALLASVYHDEPIFQIKIAEKVESLTTTLRLQIIDAASSEFDRNDTAKQILGRYDNEVDGSLKIQGAIKHYQAQYPTDSDRQAVIQGLLSDALSIGIDHDERRAAAFAGIIIYGATKQFASLEWNNKPLDISLGAYGRESQALLRLVAEHWGELDNNFDRKLISRLGSLNSESNFWAIISPYISISPTLRQAFIEYCKYTKYIGFQELQALAKEFPKSDLLLQHCISGINSLNTDRTLTSYQKYFEASYILRDQFSGDKEVLFQLGKLLQDTNHQYGISAMAIYDPYNSSLDKVEKQILSELATLENYAPSIILAASRFKTEQLGILVKRMINRSSHSMWDFQDGINSALKSRIGNDVEFVAQIGAWLVSNPTESEISSFSRYLGATGKLDEETQTLCLHLLNERNITLRIPIQGYDAISDLVLKNPLMIYK